MHTLVCTRNKSEGVWRNFNWQLRLEASSHFANSGKNLLSLKDEYSSNLHAKND